MTHPFALTSPCPQCPFRTDIKPYLRPARVDEISESLVETTFSCHKTLNPERRRDEFHCAGALILLEKIGRPSQMMRIAARLGLYDPTKLKMDAPIFGSFSEMRRAMVRAERVVRGLRRGARR